MDALNQAVAGVKSALGLGDESATTTNETAGREPISGEQGRGTLTEPFDKGNETSATSDTSASSTTLGSSSTTTAETTSVPSHPKPTTQPTTDTTPAPTNMSSSTPSEPGINTAGGIGSDTQAAGTSSSAATNQPLSTGPPAGQSRPSAGDRPGDVRPTEANENRPNQNVGGFGTAEPSVNADPKSAQQPKTAQQGGDRPLEEPDSEETKAIKDDKKEVEDEQEGVSSSSGPGHQITDEEREELAAKGKLPKDPNDHSGEPMHMHGGSEDPKSEEKEEVSGGGVTDQQRKNSIGQEGGAPHGSSKGTGEEYVKSTGLAADGGDFDASKPGAGKEATRLMEEKGMHRDSGDGPSSSGGGPVGDSASKPSAFQKIKDKMNPGTGSGLD